ncbi:MAG: thiamine phosphate synthase [Acidobacteria bacterium]|nr:MAG: thiamine phosphate synthase [Acidobacteriota bacterium]
MPASKRAARAIFQNDRPLLYYITDRRQLSGKSLTTIVRRIVSAGVDFVQIREKDLPDRQVFEMTRKIVRLAANRNCFVLVNGRADIALAAGAHGVHLPSRGMSPSDLAWLPQGFLVGVSVHSLAEARLAEKHGADYVLMGPIFPTRSKLLFGPPLGLDYLSRACLSVSIPVLALGGIHARQIPLVLSAGASGIAGISLFQKDLLCSSKPRRELARILREIPSKRNPESRIQNPEVRKKRAVLRDSGF